MEEKAIQDFYPDELSFCYGCGRLNEHGLHLKSYWNTNQHTTIAHFTPQPYHIAIPGFVYGGLIASLIDCHGTGTAALASYQAEQRAPNTLPYLRFVTASLQVDFLKPIPLGVELTLIGTVLEQHVKKVISEITVTISNECYAKGKVIAVKMPDTFLKK